MASSASAMEEGTAAAPGNATESTTSSSSRKLVLLSVFGVAAVLALAFGLGFGLNQDSDATPLTKPAPNTPATATNAASNANTPTTATNVESNTPPTPTTTSTTADDTPQDGNTEVDTTENSNESDNGGPSLAFASTRLAAISPESVSQTYASCTDLASDLKLSTRMAAQRYIESNKWYFSPTAWPVFMDDGEGGATVDSEAPAASAEGGDVPVSAPTESSANMDMAAPEAFGDAAKGSAASSSTSGGGGESSFGTNNQVQGVEEADIVQSNGVQVFAVYGSEILELDASTSTLTRRIQVPPSGDCKDPINAMLLVGERLVVILSKYSYCANGPISDVVTTPTTLPPDEMPIISTNDGTRVVIFDTTTGAALSDEVIRGYYANSRAIGSNVHIVTNTYFDVWRLLQFLDPYMLETEAGAKLNETEYQRLAEAELEKRLDNYANTLASELDCKGTQKISLLQNTDDDLSFSSNIESLVSITSFAATNPASNSTKNMLIPSGGLQVYSSAERLVLAIQGWWMSSSASQETYLVTYKYANATTVGSTLGSVPGYILNQFSMDHINQNDVDYLRVATSTQSIWAPNAEGIWENTANSTSQVSILQFNDGAAGAMPMVGKITDLGKPGEQIYSVRFIGDKGFVVTFLQTDPFYTLDLSDPTNPQVAGELEIPGYSSYLHPAGENAIIGVGQAADANGTITGLQISLFDVSDFSNPVRVQNLEVSSRNSSMSSGASSEAEYDHKALRYLPESKLLIIPVTYYEYTVVPCNYETDVPMPVSETVTTKQATASDEAVDSSMPIDRPWWPTECYNNTGGFDGFRVYKIDEVAGISQHFAIEHASGNDFAYGCWSSAFLQARSLVFEGELMTMKGHSILSNDLTTLQQIAAPIILDNEEEECHTWMY